MTYDYIMLVREIKRKRNKFLVIDIYAGIEPARKSKTNESRDTEREL